MINIFFVYTTVAKLLIFSIPLHIMRKKIDPKALFLATNGGGKVYIETYGCQMNVGDSEVVISLLSKNGWSRCQLATDADLILVNTCAVRDNAESRVWGRLRELKRQKKLRPWVLIGVIGCMAERLKEKLIEIEKTVDIVVGPDAYRSLPELVKTAANGNTAINTILSQEETYAEISPVRMDKNGVSAFVSIMRGCNNMCSYCVVPYTRGAERSRSDETIIDEVKELIDNGYKEVTLLGQNVNSYQYGDVNFAKLLQMTADLSSNLRVRFATSHPKDFSDEVINVIAKNDNICNSVHLPAQSGSSRMLELMNRKYTREWYLERVSAIKKAIPDCSLSTDIIAGFCGETQADHELTLSLMKEVGYEFAYMFKYSMRAGTKAQRTMADDVSEDIKSARLSEIIALQAQLSHQSNQRAVGKTYKVLVEGISKKSKTQLHGRSPQNTVVVFDKGNHEIGDYVNVEITECTPATLKGVVVE